MRKNWNQFQLERDQRHNHKVVLDPGSRRKGKKERSFLFVFVRKDFFDTVAKCEWNFVA